MRVRTCAAFFLSSSSFLLASSAAFFFASSFATRQTDTHTKIPAQHFRGTPQTNPNCVTAMQRNTPTMHTQESDAYFLLLRVRRGLCLRFLLHTVSHTHTHTQQTQVSTTAVSVSAHLLLLGLCGRLCLRFILIRELGQDSGVLCAAIGTCAFFFLSSSSFFLASSCTRINTPCTEQRQDTQTTASHIRPCI